MLNFWVVGRAAKIGIGLYIAWLVVFVLLLGSNRIDRNTRDLFGLLPLWGPLLLLALLTVAAWIERRLKR